MPDPTYGGILGPQLPAVGQREQQRQAPLGPFGSFLRGIVGSISKQQQQDKVNVENARRSALSFLDQIPDSPENNPVKFKLAMDILASKPGAKHWTDAVFATGDSTNQYVNSLWDRIRSAVPSQGDLAYAYGGDVPLPAGKLNLAAQDSAKYTPVTVTTDEETGEKSLVLFDAKTGKPLVQRIGKGITEKERIANIAATSRTAAQKRLAESKITAPTLGRAVTKASEAGITPAEFIGLLSGDVEDQAKAAPFIQSAAKEMEEEAKAKVDIKTATTEKTKEQTKGVTATTAKTQAQTKKLGMEMAGTLPARKKAGAGTGEKVAGEMTAGEKRLRDTYKEDAIRLQKELDAKTRVMNSAKWAQMSRKEQQQMTKDIEDLKNRVQAALNRVPKPTEQPARTQGGSQGIQKKNNDPLGIR